MSAPLVIILAGGRQERLQGLHGSKCLLDVNGEPNLCRTLRLLESFGHDLQSVVIVGDVNCCTAHHCGYHRIPAAPSKGQSIAAAAAAEWSMASGLVLLGDVIWQRRELEYIYHHGNPRVTYVHRENPHTRKSWGECLACVYDVSSLVNVQFVGALRELRQRAHFTEIDLHGWSDDIDTQEDLDLRYPVLCGLAARAEQQTTNGA